MSGIFSHKICNIFFSGSVHGEFNSASIVHLYKQKCNKCKYNNYRGISYLCVAGKRFGKIILNRLKSSQGDSVLSEAFDLIEVL